MVTDSKSKSTVTVLLSLCHLLKKITNADKYVGKKSISSPFNRQIKKVKKLSYRIVIKIKLLNYYLFVLVLHL